ncbi:MAG: hypothetical protein OXE86_12590 [Alphaproteobacteria bacterium]|nr:hypothetical protein [Alphaproteobacteria bacterium]
MTLDAYWSDLEQVLALAALLNEVSGEDPQERSQAWEKVLGQSDLVDPERTGKEGDGDSPPRRVWCTGAYGVRYLEKSGSWVPFRHGEIEIELPPEEVEAEGEMVENAVDANEGEGADPGTVDSEQDDTV